MMKKPFGLMRSAVGVALLGGCESEPPVVRPSPPPTVVVARPVVRTVTDREEFTGRTDAVYSVNVLSRVSGYLQKVLLHDGAEVKQGDVLFEIDPRPYEAEAARAAAAVAKAEAHLKRLEADYQRANHLYDRGVIGREEFDLINGDREEARAARDSAVEARKLARLNLEWTRVTARISGTASRRMVDPGALVKADETVLTNIVTQDPLYVYFDVNEQTLLRLRRLISEGSIDSRDGKDVPVFIGLADQPDFGLRGMMDFTENKTDPNTGTLRLRGTVRNPAPHMLSAGMFVNVRLPVGDPHESLMVPEQAIGTDQGRKFVYVVDDHDEVVYRPVQLGFAEDGLRVIDQGLKAGERVVTADVQRIRPGLKVVPQLNEPQRAAVKAATGERVSVRH